MRILVTGGAGFLGSHVADALTEAGHKVIVFDQQNSPYLKEEQEMAVGSILDYPLIEKLVSRSDIIYHFAGIADIDECKQRPIDTVNINILGTVNLLESAIKANIKRFVFASSAYVYSDAGYFYRCSKQACEAYIETYNKLHGLEYTCLRYGSLYGPRADERNSIFKLIKQALHNKKITYYGTGNEIREFIHVKDAADISVKILSDEFINENVVLTGPEKMQYIELLSMIKEMLHDNVDIEILPSTRDSHYKITPYNFSPKVGRKIVNNPHIDMGQGLLQCMSDIFENVIIK
ncbi:NAD-dependent epimerase/dehydratase family protein [Desulfovibrio litoralis]|uniref:UDP-glucose 4-epimerase n=1 Tax=Desulfovibrio litoralis DSM 11393 TaxID=1121455 RepID=A0A1M7RSJ7_9BACT|nr:SDR family NAD(P)-dependent oxidoreductase [Desulfovibrio litoralis]SHN49058.1 UDP-glucose 4-epimerase [Desulfovibrio litoralis DSM 11393]